MPFGVETFANIPLKQHQESDLHIKTYSNCKDVHCMHNRSNNVRYNIDTLVYLYIITINITSYHIDAIIKVTCCNNESRNL